MTNQLIMYSSRAGRSRRLSRSLIGLQVLALVVLATITSSYGATKIDGVDTTTSGYATGTPVYTESDPVWLADKPSYATGTPVYVESDPDWAGASNGVLSIKVTSSSEGETNSPVTRDELFEAIESIAPLLLYGDTNAHPVIPGAATLSGHRPAAWSIVSSLSAGTNYIGTYFDTNTTTLIRAGVRQGRLTAIQTDGNRTAYPVIIPCWTDDDGATTNCIGESEPVEAFTDNLLSRTPSYSLATNIVGTNLREGVSYYLVREAAAGTCEITTYGGEGYNTLLETQQRGPVEGYVLSSGDTMSGDLNMGGNVLTNVGGLQIGTDETVTDISTGAADNDKLATKGYVDDNAGGSGGSPAIKYVNPSDYWYTATNGPTTNIAAGVVAHSNGWAVYSSEYDDYQTMYLYADVPIQSISQAVFSTWSSGQATGSNYLDITLICNGYTYSTGNITASGEAWTDVTIEGANMPTNWVNLASDEWMTIRVGAYTYRTNSIGFPRGKLYQK